jgi:hypothetical protein
MKGTIACAVSGLAQEIDRIGLDQYEARDRAPRLEGVGERDEAAIGIPTRCTGAAIRATTSSIACICIAVEGVASARRSAVPPSPSRLVVTHR